MTQSEEAIRLDVIDQLKGDTRVDISNIDVEVSEATVKLTGTMLSCEIYHLSRDMARYTPKVIDVQNALLAG